MNTYLDDAHQAVLAADDAWLPVPSIKAAALTLLAVADELRTANLLTMLALHADDQGVLEYGESDPLVKDIRTRLGLDS